MARPGLLAGLLATALALAAAGCSSDAPAAPRAEPVATPPTIALDPTGDQECGTLLADLPPTLAGLQRTGATDREVRYGSPPLLVRCGVGVPAGFDPSSAPGPGEPSPCTEVNGVGWWIPAEQVDGAGDGLFTAVTFAPRVAVLVPHEHLPEAGAGALAELAAPIQATLTPDVRCT